MKILLLFAISMSLVACSIQSRDRSATLNNAVNANKEAKSYMELEASEHNPDRIFVEWNRQLIMKELTSAQVCADLEKVEIENLIIFEGQIRSGVNVALLKDCQQELIFSLDKYWELQKPAMTNISGQGTANNFKFPENIQYRNLENGYVAYTGDVGKNEVILTFDDGPSGVYTKSILKSLAEVNAKAIFFMTGENIKRHKDLVNSVAEQGHAVGGHSMTHWCLPSTKVCKANNEKFGGRMLTLEEAKLDIRNTFKTIIGALGYADPFFRFPYGETSKDLRSYLKENRVAEFPWTIDSDDWNPNASWTVIKMIDSIMNQLNNSKGRRGHVLFHDKYKRTEVALPFLLNRLYHEGYSVVLLKADEKSPLKNLEILNSK